jgi:aldehyde:ferredoxin oxidoreductase
MKKVVSRSAVVDSAKGARGGETCREFLSREDVQRFQDIYKEQFGVEISKEEAYEQGIKLLTLVRCVYKPMTVKEAEAVDSHRVATTNYLIKRLNVK